MFHCVLNKLCDYKIYPRLLWMLFLRCTFSTPVEIMLTSMPINELSIKFFVCTIKIYIYVCVFVCDNVRECADLQLYYIFIRS